MSSDEAKQLIEQLLAHFTPGSVLHLLGEILRNAADALGDGDPLRQEQLRDAEAALFIVGLGLDSSLPD